MEVNHGLKMLRSKNCRPLLKLRERDDEMSDTSGDAIKPSACAETFCLRFVKLGQIQFWV
jgi:hypothetical protein